ncbi:MAG: PH domain-containing protein [Roseiflexaceae bacterium]|jgi:hypothetical protein
MKGIGMPQIYEPAPLDAAAQQTTQQVVFMGSVLTLPSLFLVLSGLLRYDIAYFTALACCLMAALVLGYVGWRWAGQVRLIELTDTQLVVRRRLWRALIVPITHINAVALTPLAIDIVATRWRTGAGVFGYLGTFASPRYGRMQAVASDRERLVAIGRSAALLLILSPADPFAFVDGVRAVLPTSTADRK